MTAIAQQTFATLVLALLAVLGLSACNISTPFRTSGEPVDPDQVVVVAITHAVIKEDAHARARFFDHVATVEESLPANEGFIGFSKRRRVLGNEAWTMTVWTDEDSLNAFMHSPAHLAAIRTTGEVLEAAHFGRVSVRADALPLTWEQGLEILQNSRRGY